MGGMGIHYWALAPRRRSLGSHPFWGRGGQSMVLWSISAFIREGNWRSSAQPCTTNAHRCSWLWRRSLVIQRGACSFSRKKSDSARAGSEGLDAGRPLITPDVIMKVVLAEAKRTLGSNTFRREAIPLQVQSRDSLSFAGYCRLTRQDKWKKNFFKRWLQSSPCLSASSFHMDSRLIHMNWKYVIDLRKYVTDLRKEPLRAGSMPQCVKMLATKPDDLSSTWWKENTDPYKLGEHAEAHVHPRVYIHTCTYRLNK